MKKILVILILSAALPIQAASLITNGSFETDGLTSWDVDIPDNFRIYVDDDWSTHGANSLRTSSVIYDYYDAGDAAYISQQVDLTGVNELIFDVNLSSYDTGPGPWDGTKVTAFVSIDAPQNYRLTTASDADGAYYDVNAPLDSYTGIHTLYFGMKVGVTGMLMESYNVQLDFVKLDAFCGGFGHFVSDLNRDCYVDFADLKIMADNWLRDDLIPADDYLDLAPDGYIDLFDFVVFADEWMQCTYWADINCFEVPLDLSADINIDGIVNFFDYEILSANWPVPMDEKADIDESGVVDYNDLKIMNSQWLQKSWLYKN